MSKRSPVPGLLSALTSLGGRGGAALGNAYALGARVVLNGWERLEDLNAERRFRQRSTGSATKALARLKSAPSRRVPAARTH